MLNVEIPPGLTGIHFVFVRTDRNNAVAEINESNNTGFDATPADLQLPPPVDLIVAGINSPGAGSPGESATIQWTVNNAGSNTANGQWTDAVYLSTDQVWDINDMLVGRYDKFGPVPNGQSYTGSLTAPLPPVAPGSYYVIVRTDVRNRVFESNEGNNTTVSVGRTTIDVTELTLGVARNSDIRTGQERYYKVNNVPANETLLFSLDGQNPLTSNELYTRFNFLPSLSAFDYLFSKPYQSDQETLVPDTQAGNYFSMVRGAYVSPGSSPDPFSIKAEILPFSILSVGPAKAGNAGEVTLKVTGAKFDEFTRVALKRGVVEVRPIWMKWRFPDTIYATFDLRNATPGKYDVYAISETTRTYFDLQVADVITVPQINGQYLLQEGFEIVQGGAASIEVAMSHPQYVRVGRVFQSSLEVKNTGNIDAPIPVLLIASVDDTPLSLTSAVTANSGVSLQLVPLSPEGRRDRLSPEQQTIIPIYGYALRPPKASMRVVNLSYLDNQSINWESQKEYYRTTTGYPDWEGTWGNFKNTVGSTYSSLFSAYRSFIGNREVSGLIKYYECSSLIRDLLSEASQQSEESNVNSESAIKRSVNAHILGNFEETHRQLLLKKNTLQQEAITCQQPASDMTISRARYDSLVE